MTLKDCKCPNCGASVNTDICDYCGTSFSKTDSNVINLPLHVSEVSMTAVNAGIFTINDVRSMRYY